MRTVHIQAHTHTDESQEGLRPTMWGFWILRSRRLWCSMRDERGALIDTQYYYCSSNLVHRVCISRSIPASSYEIGTTEATSVFWHT